jgi:membrane protease YdiL (CAAX protease family)
VDELAEKAQCNHSSEIDAGLSIPDKSSGKPWGIWLTLLFSGIIVALFVFAQITVAVIFICISGSHDPDKYVKALNGGLFLSVATCVGALPVICLSFLLALAKRGISVREYLGFRKIKILQYVSWILIIVLFIAINDNFSYFMGWDIVPKVVLDTYSSACIMPLLIFAVVVVAPLSEEIFFRGFLFKGLQASRLGSRGAVIIAAASWALLHLQYDFYGVISIFAGGILMGLAKCKTKSLLAPIAMHSVMNIVATLQAVFILN